MACAARASAAASVLARVRLILPLTLDYSWQDGMKEGEPRTVGFTRG